MNYIESVLANLGDKYRYEPEFLQAVTEVYSSIAPCIRQNEDFYKKNAILERLSSPDRIITFRVTWRDRDGNLQVNNGYRVQFSNAIGVYKGGLRFQDSVNLSIMKFLAFEQVFKNALTCLSLGGAKGGSDFSPYGKTDLEIMNFCQSYISELYKYIGSDTDVPAGDIGVGEKEIGYMFGYYKKIKTAFDCGAFTGKNQLISGSALRPEATGYGSVYFLQKVLLGMQNDVHGTTFCLSGFGNVAQGAAKKIADLGGKILTVSGRDGYIYFKDGMPKEAVSSMKDSRESGESKECFAKRFHGEYIYGKSPFGKHVADVVMPCATQNEITLKIAENIVKSGVKIVNEASNMPITPDATKHLKAHGVIICPSKASNAGGVAVSGLEMSQNAMRQTFTDYEVDEKLREIMNGIYDKIILACDEYGLNGDLISGANVCSFLRVARATLMQGAI